MRNRWKVERRHAAWPEPHFRWEVIEKIDGLEDFHGPFDSHPEAMTYADRMARTIQATLPRTPLPTGMAYFRHYIAGKWEDTEITHYPGAEQTLIRADYREPDSAGDVIAISDDLLKPVALYLLTLSRKDTTHDH